MYSPTQATWNNIHISSVPAHFRRTLVTGKDMATTNITLCDEHAPPSLYIHMHRSNSVTLYSQQWASGLVNQHPSNWLTDCQTANQTANSQPKGKQTIAHYQWKLKHIYKIINKRRAVWRAAWRRRDMLSCKDYYLHLVFIYPEYNK